jgi:UDP-N-acetylmuramoyl-L-alanyl-D-glutamate--2,6-diaminopimelate ligase
MPRDIILQDLARDVGGELLGAESPIPIGDVTHDSRRSGPGVLFVAVRGFTVDGHEFLEQAVKAGAAAVCVERPSSLAAPQLVVPDTRSALPRLAAAVHHHPSRRLRVVGITGTNGKTTVAYLLDSIAGAAGLTSAVVGTIGGRIGGRSIAVGRTTPEAPDLQRLLADMVDAHVDVAAVEVSSHALALHRVDAVAFEVGAFTNLTQDHLDFHKDLDDYYRAKASLFESDRTRHAVIWVDDPHGARLAADVAIPVTTVGLTEGAEIRAGAVDVTPTGSTFELLSGDKCTTVDLPLGGAFNVENALVAAACATVLGIDTEAIARGLGSVSQIPGRFEKIEAGQDFAVIVDYAHTPDGITAVIEAARAVSKGAVIVVVGAGGDRDRLKRPAMGEAAARADIAVITSDNPRSEDPRVIIDEVVRGARPAGSVRVVPDRREAIRQAVRAAAPGDVVLILGKGHEQGQEIAGRVEPFDDREVAAAVLAAGEVSS